MSHYLVMLLLLHSVTPINLYKDCFPQLTKTVTSKAELQVYSTTLKFVILEEAIEQVGECHQEDGRWFFIENQKFGAMGGSE